MLYFANVQLAMYLTRKNVIVLTIYMTFFKDIYYINPVRTITDTTNRLVILIKR